MYAPRGRGVQVSYTFLLRITCKKKKGGGGEEVQIACKNAYVINGRLLINLDNNIPSQSIKRRTSNIREGGGGGGSKRICEDLLQKIPITTYSVISSSLYV